MSKIKIEICRVRAVAKKTLLEKNLAKAAIDNVINLFVCKNKKQSPSQDELDKSEPKN